MRADLQAGLCSDRRTYNLSYGVYIENSLCSFVKARLVWEVERVLAEMRQATIQSSFTAQDVGFSAKFALKPTALKLLLMSRVSGVLHIDELPCCASFAQDTSLPQTIRNAESRQGQPQYTTGRWPRKLDA